MIQVEEDRYAELLRAEAIANAASGLREALERIAACNFDNWDWGGMTMRDRCLRMKQIAMDAIAAAPETRKPEASSS